MVVWQGPLRFIIAPVSCIRSRKHKLWWLRLVMNINEPCEILAEALIIKQLNAYTVGEAVSVTLFSHLKKSSFPHFHKDW